MPRIQWKGWVIIDPDIYNEDSCIRGTRVPVNNIVGSMADGMRVDEVRRA